MKSNKQLYLFLAKCAALFVVWNIAYYAWIQQGTDLEFWLTSKTSDVCVSLLNALDYQASNNHVMREADKSQSYSMITIDGVRSLNIADSCNALTLMVLFVGFVMAYPGSVLYKVPYILLGSIVIFLINVVRAISLIFIHMYFNPYIFQFHHKYTFTIMVYLCVFAFWMLWVGYFSKKTWSAAAAA